MSYSAEVWPDIIEIVDETTDEVITKIYARGWATTIIRAELIHRYGQLGETMSIIDHRYGAR